MLRGSGGQDVAGAAALGRSCSVGLAASGALIVPLETLPLNRAAEALDRQAPRGVRGKLVLLVDRVP